MDKVLKSMATLVIARPQWKVNMTGLVEAAKLYLERKTTGEDAFCRPDRDGWIYAFAPFPRRGEVHGDVYASPAMRDAATLLFGDALGQYPRSDQFLPYLLTKLCGDLLNEKTAQWVVYSSEECGYANDMNGLQIRLKKHIDYCSYHDLTVSFAGPKWNVTIVGCWRGSQQDPGPVHHPESNSYHGRVNGSYDTVTSHKLSGEKSEQGFALWGIDLARLGIKVPKRKAA